MQIEMFEKKQKLHPQQLEMLERIAAALSNMGCKWVIIQPDGVQRGNMEVKVAKGKHRKLKYPYGTIAKYIGPYVDGLKIGERVDIPFHDTIDEADILGAVSARACKMWGNGMHSASINRKTKNVEVHYHGGI